MKLNLDKQTGLKFQVNLPEGLVQTPEIRLVITDKNNPKGLSVVVPSMTISDDGIAQMVVPPLGNMFSVDQDCEAVLEVIAGTQYFTGGSMLVEMVVTKPALPKTLPVELFEEEEAGDFGWLLKEDAVVEPPKGVSVADELAAAKVAWEAQKKAILEEEAKPAPTKEDLVRQKIKKQIKEVLLGSPGGKKVAAKSSSPGRHSTKT